MIQLISVPVTALVMFESLFGTLRERAATSGRASCWLGQQRQLFINARLKKKTFLWGEGN